MRRILKLLAVAALCAYGGVLALLYVKQREMMYPRNPARAEIASANLDQWRRLVEQSEAGPVKDLFKYKVETAWFGVQGFREQTYTRWAEILQEHGIDPTYDLLNLRLIELIS